MPATQSYATCVVSLIKLQLQDNSKNLRDDPGANRTLQRPRLLALTILSYASVTEASPFSFGVTFDPLVTVTQGAYCVDVAGWSNSVGYCKNSTCFVRDIFFHLLYFGGNIYCPHVRGDILISVKIDIFADGLPWPSLWLPVESLQAICRAMRSGADAKRGQISPAFMHRGATCMLLDFAEDILTAC